MLNHLTGGDVDHKINRYSIEISSTPNCHNMCPYSIKCLNPDGGCCTGPDYD